jgi:hypothetical protein
VLHRTAAERVEAVRRYAVVQRVAIGGRAATNRFASGCRAPFSSAVPQDGIGVVGRGRVTAVGRRLEIKYR